MKPTPPLSGIRILDLSRVMAGPWATQCLADLGAEIIKIERPGAGDDTRAWGPPFLEGTQESAYYLSANRGKKSVAIDISKPEGQAIIRRLAEKSDAVIENFKAGGLKAYGLDYDSLQRANPKTIYCSITGFGQDGPYAHVAGYDYMIQAMSGLMSITGEKDGAPMRFGVPIVDLMTGMYAAQSILAALFKREREGQGSRIDLALFDVALSMLANQASNYLVSGNVPGRIGNTHPTIVPYQLFQTADNPFVLAVGNDGQFRKFCDVTGTPELGRDPRYATNKERVKNRAALTGLLEPVFRARTAQDWFELLAPEGIPCSPVFSIEQALAHKQAMHRGAVGTYAHPSGSVRHVVSPMRGMAGETSAPPLLGEQTENVLKETLGLSAHEIAALRTAGAIG